MRRERLLTIIKAPHVTEKASYSAGKGRQYAFKVATDSNKIEIKQAIEQLFNVKVSSVRTSNVKSRVARFGKTMGRHKAWKKAYIALEAGHEIDTSAVAE